MYWTLYTYQTLEEVLPDLETVILASETPDGLTEIIIDADHPPHLPWILLAVPSETVIDWESQWGHKEKSLLLPNGDTLLLSAGPGFGDHTHPTTILALEMLAACDLMHTTVIDIGSGSGILILAAKKLGASHAIGVEIDPLAIAHAQQNAVLNQLDALFQTHLTSPMEDPLILVINMITSEQKIAWASLPSVKGTLIVSGMLVEEKITYDKWAPGQLIEERQQEGWLAQRRLF